MLDSKSLLKLPVWTRGGTHLGRVAGFDFDEGAQMIVRWRVRPLGMAARIVGNELLVGREQVVSITAEKMTVDDAAVQEMELVRAKALGLVPDAA